VISVNDPDARHTRKSQQARRDGYRARVAAGPETGIITGEKLTRAAGTENSGPAVAQEFVAAGAGTGEAAGGGRAGGAGDRGGMVSWYGDPACGTGELRDAIGQAGHRAVIKPKPLQAPVEGGFTADDFAVDEENSTVSCPAGITRAIPPRRHAVFGGACRTCPLRARCTTSKSGRALSLTPHDRLLRGARAGWAADPGLRADCKARRPNVERTIAQAATWRGRRLKLRYRGVTTNHAWLKRRTAALNLQNLTGKGLTRRDGTRALAT
jgi:hypothetical protein